ncbi:helix-turn-helix transcriptional regulator [Gracilibacillus sp. D59]|uniref:helix-turn-helix transcriptional regulator n=1 Tax=Gracilibacillus sp. D59 TaxID=3457434 RepID=UPI003FCE0801
MLQIKAPPLPTFIEAGEDTYIKGMTHPDRHHIGVFDLLLVTEGCLEMGEGENIYEVEGAHILILYPDRHHFSVKPCKDKTHFFWMHFQPEEWSDMNHNTFRIKDYSNSGPFKEKPFSFLLPKYSRIHNERVVIPLCEQILSSENQWHKQLLFQQLLFQISQNVTHQTNSHDLIIAEQAAGYLKNQLSQKISYQDLGSFLGYHPNHIARCMKEVFNCTPIEYLNRVRLDQAKVLLVTTNLSMEHIAEKCGFSHISYFSRIFKKVEGLSPSAYRKKYIR